MHSRFRRWHDKGPEEIGNPSGSVTQILEDDLFGPETDQRPNLPVVLRFLLTISQQLCKQTHGRQRSDQPGP